MSSSIVTEQSARFPFGLSLYGLVVLASLLLSIWLFGGQGVNESTALLFTRYTARVSFMFFLPVFTIQALHILRPGEFTRYLMKKRRAMGLSFALAHTVHLAAIVLFFVQVDQSFTASDIPALAIYFFIGIMAITSNAFSMRRLGSMWKVIHKIGLYGAFTGFFVTYLGRVQGYDTAEVDPGLKEAYWVYVLLAVLVSVAWLVRIAAFWKKRLG